MSGPAFLAIGGFLIAAFGTISTPSEGCVAEPAVVPTAMVLTGVTQLVLAACAKFVPKRFVAFAYTIALSEGALLFLVLTSALYAILASDPAECADSMSFIMVGSLITIASVLWVSVARRSVVKQLK